MRREEEEDEGEAEEVEEASEIRQNRRRLWSVGERLVSTR